MINGMYQSRVVALRLIGRSVARAITRRPFDNSNTERASAWLHPSHPLRIVFSRHFAAKRRRTEAELTEAAVRGVVVISLRGARAERRWLAAQARALSDGRP